jgi:hypothetical protein
MADAIIQMDQHEFARPDAAPGKAGGERADTLMKFAVTPDPRRRVERRPDQKRMVAPRRRAHRQQPRHIHPRKGPHHARRDLRT